MIGMTKKEIILVDKNDNQIGVGEKIKVHQEGNLHRSFSIFVFNSQGQMMLQKRAGTKYHSPGLWTNVCCSHPRPNKDIAQEAKKRLEEEMGFPCPLKDIFTFIYKVELGKLFEHEFDHVFVGKFDGLPQPDKQEVEDWKWISADELRKDVEEHPEKYAFWFKKIFTKVLEYTENAK